MRFGFNIGYVYGEEKPEGNEIKAKGARVLATLGFSYWD
jgi:hypothetical protein